MICLCYNKEKGLFFVDEKFQKRNDVVVIKSHESKGFKTILGFVPGTKFKIEVDSNFGYGRGSYLSVRLLLSQDKGKKYILNFDKTLHEHRGMRLDTVCAFFFDPDAEDKWEKVFNFILSVFNKRDEQKFVGVLQYIGDICNDLRIGADRLKQGNNVLLEDAYGYGNLPYRSHDLLDGLQHSYVTEDNAYIHLFKDRLKEKSIEYIKAAQQWLLSNNCIHELKYRVVRVLSDKIINHNANLKKELAPLHIRKIDHCQSLRQIKDSSIWYGQWSPIYAMSISDKTNAEISLFGESESSQFEGAWMFIDNSVDEYLKTPDGVESFWTLLPSKSPDSDVFTISHEKGKYQVVRLVDSKLQEIDLGHTYSKIGGFNHDLALVQQGNLFGIVDINGNIVVDVKYDYIADFYQNWSDVIRLDKDGVIMQENLKSLLNKDEEDSNKEFVNDVYDADGENTKIQIEPLSLPIREIGCVNFKRFEEITDLPINQLNFIVGANNAGKSTYLDLAELLLHIIPLLKKGFNSFENLITFVVRYNNLQPEIWWVNGYNKEKVDFDYDLVCQYNTYRKLINTQHCGENFVISMIVGSITFLFSLNEKEENCFVTIKDDQNIGFTLYSSKRISLTEEFCSLVNIDGKEIIETREYSLSSVISAIKYKSLSKVIDDSEEMKFTLAYNIDYFYKKICVSIDAATDVRHFHVFNGKINMPFCRGFFSASTGEVTDEIRAFVNKSLKVEDREDAIINITSARDKIIIPFIHKWLHEFELGEYFSLQYGFGEPKYMYDVLKQGRPISKNEVLDNRNKFQQFIDNYLPQISTEISPHQQDEVETLYIDGEKDVRFTGTGTQHLVSLIFSLSRFMLENILRDKTLPVLLIEEPEQNLHPKWQSLLADFFLDVTRVQKRILKDYGMSSNKDVRELQIIVETHSEYLIRKTQAMVAQGNIPFDNNPINVYYFPENGMPFDMGYQTSGMFENKFGAGFFDESSRQQYVVLKKARESK